MTDMKSNRAIHWIARIASVASIGLLAAFIAGGIGEGKMPTANEWVGLACFPAGVIIGLAWGWRAPLIGGLIALGSLTAFYLWHLVGRSSFPTGPYFVLFTSPAILYLLAYALAGRQQIKSL